MESHVINHVTLTIKLPETWTNVSNFYSNATPGASLRARPMD